MKINLFKPENNKKHIVNITADVMTLTIAAVIIMAFVVVGVSALYREVKELFTPKATYLVYHCKKGKKTERVPMVVDGVIKTETDIWNLTADIAAGKNCKVIIEPNWRTIKAERTIKSSKE
jgi:hypothetical protein